MIDLKNLKEIVKLMVTNGLTEIDLQDQAGERVTLKRAGNEVQQSYVAVPQPAPVLAAAPAAAPAAAKAEPAADAGLIPIRSPMVGTFYVAPSPDAKPFTSVGATITSETVVCTIVAMKVLNEIKAEVAGTIEKVLVTNGQAVEFGQPLFLVRP